MKFKYNLQFFAEGSDDDDTKLSNDGTDDNGSSSGDGSEIDASAFADLISEKDKQIAELQKDMAKLKKSNAELLVKVSAGAGSNTEKTYEENLLELVGAKPRKE